MIFNLFVQKMVAFAKKKIKMIKILDFQRNFSKNDGFDNPLTVIDRLHQTNAVGTPCKVLWLHKTDVEYI